MELSHIIGYIASVLIGLSLGLLGSGGSILTVPVLVYLFALDAVVATFYSLFIVGFTAAIGSVSYLKNNLVNFKLLLVFGLPSLVTVFFTRAFIVPIIPTQLFIIHNFSITKNIVFLLLFAVLMVVASVSMIKKNKPTICNETKKTNYALLIVQGMLLGIITGLVGAGGGFLIIPALVMLSKIAIKEAIGTSLVIVTLNSLIGFLSSGNLTSVNWVLLISIIGFASIGILIGMFLSKKINASKLKPLFGWFVLTMGVYIIVKEGSRIIN